MVSAVWWGSYTRLITDKTFECDDIVQSDMFFHSVDGSQKFLCYDFHPLIQETSYGNVNVKQFDQYGTITKNNVAASSYTVFSETTPTQSGLQQRRLINPVELHSQQKLLCHGYSYPDKAKDVHNYSITPIVEPTIKSVDGNGILINDTLHVL